MAVLLSPGSDGKCDNISMLILACILISPGSQELVPTVIDASWPGQRLYLDLTR